MTAFSVSFDFSVFFDEDVGFCWDDLGLSVDVLVLVLGRWDATLTGETFLLLGDFGDLESAGLSFEGTTAEGISSASTEVPTSVRSSTVSGTTLTVSPEGAEVLSSTINVTS